MKNTCEDFKVLGKFEPPKDPVCHECVKKGAGWVHLRTCQHCGITLCCDSSDNKHMTAHHHQTGHALIISAEPGEKWAYCYKHELFTPYP